MSKNLTKEQVVSNLKESFSKTLFAVATDYRGMSVSEITDLRKRLKESNADYKIAKNTLIKLAIKDTNLTELEKHLEGPTAVLIGYGEPTDCAKTFVEFIKEVEKGDVKGAILDGKLLSKEQIKVFASLPSKKVLLGQIAGLLVAPTAGIAGAFESLIRDIALLVEEVAKKNGGGVTNN